MALESLPKIAPALFSAEQDLIQIYNKKSDTFGVINPSYIKSSPSGVSGAIQFSDGSAFASDAANLFWDNTNKRLGVGTSSPTELLTVGSSGKIGLLSPSFGQTTTIDVNGYQGLNIVTGPNSTQGVIINGYGSAPNSLSATNSSNNTIRNYVITYRGGSGKGVLIDPISTSVGESTASLQVKGSGSTSATTSLLVQNSGGTQTYKLDDGGNITNSGSLTMPTGHITVVGSGGYVIGLNGTVALPWVRATSGTACLMQATSNAKVECNANDTFITGFNTSIRSGERKSTFTVTCNDFSANNNLNNFVTVFSGTLGTNTFNQIALSPSGTPGSGTPNYRGIYINPLQTGFGFVRAIESTVGGAYFNTSSVSSSAILQADSTTQGFLPPRMTTAQKNAIVTPAAGLMVYDTTLNKLCVYTTAWETITSV